jgi:Peptidase family M28
MLVWRVLYSIRTNGNLMGDNDGPGVRDSYKFFMLTRRQFARLCAFAPMMSAAGSVTAAGSGGEAMRARIKSVIAEFDAQGIHRTGTEVDQASARWMAGRIARMGLSPEITSFSFKRVEVQTARVSLMGVNIDGVPLYDCNFTDAAGITGRAGEINGDADIGVAMSLPYAASPGGKAVHEARKAGRHKAIIIVTDDRLPDDGVATLNAEDYRQPFGPPVLQVPSRHWADIQGAMANTEKITLIAHADYIDSTASNVGATIDGLDPSLPPLVIMTPRSGWWQCASERGGGIAAYLEMMRAIADSRPERTVIFTANTGHELGHTGLDHYLDEHPALIAGAYLWVHLGANFAARHGANVRLQYSDARAKTEMATIMDAHGVKPGVTTPIGNRPLGEARNVHDGGGRYISILGSNALFHHPADRWPDAVDLDVTYRWTRALTELGVDLAGGPGL